MNSPMNRFVVAVLLVTPVFARAQGATRAHPDAETTDTVLLQRADSAKVGDYCRLAQRILADDAVTNALGTAWAPTRANTEVICNPTLASFSLRSLMGRSPAPFAAVARMHHGDADRAAKVDLFDVMDEIRADLRQPSLIPLVRTALGADHAMWVQVTETADALTAKTSRDKSLKRLANYERKLGPNSAKLNFPEVVLNYAAQRWIWFFRPSPTGGPSPWEVIASYSPAYITFPEDNAGAVPVSVSEFGLRFYLFGDSFGKSGNAGLLLPSYLSFGVITASDENGTLVWPWKGNEASGWFISWGTLKVGYIDRANGRWLVSKAFQAVPFVF